MSSPPIDTLPASTSYSRSSRLSSVDLPAPEGPTMATTVPGRASKLASSSTGRAASKPNRTPSKVTPSPISGSGFASGLSATSGGTSSRKKARFKPTLMSCRTHQVVASDTLRPEIAMKRSCAVWKAPRFHTAKPMNATNP